MIILHDKSYMAFLFINQGTYYAAPHLFILIGIFLINEYVHSFIWDGEIQMKALGSYSSTNSW